MRWILIALMMVVVAGCSAEPGHSAGDVAFAQALIPHHRQGIELARAVARHPETRVLAEAIIVTQQDEVVRMSDWLRKWGEQPPAATEPAPVSGDPIEALVAHQQEAIDIAQREQSDGRDPDAVAFAHQVVESRSEQIVRLRLSAPPG